MTTGSALNGDQNAQSNSRSATPTPLLADVEAGRVDIIVIYKIDRLTRSLTDFVRLIDVLDRYGASFVSVSARASSPA